MRLPWKKEIRAGEQLDNEEKSNEAELLRAFINDVEITKEKALEIPAISSGIEKIAASVAAIEFKLYKKENETPKLQKNDNRMFLLNHDPGDTLDSVQFWKAVVADYFLDKGGYIYINKFLNEVVSLHYVRADNISFYSNNDPIFKTYHYMVNGKRYWPGEFMNILRNSKDGWKGKTIIQENQLLLKVAYCELKLEENQLSKGGNKKGFIMAEKKLDESAMTRLKEAFSRLYSNNSDNVVVLNNGLKFQESSNTSVEMQLAEMKEANDNEIYKLLQIPPPVMNGTATEEDTKKYCMEAVKPILDAIICQTNRELLLEREKGSFYYDYDIGDLMKGDTKTRYDAYKTALEAGFIGVDEVRIKENMEPLGLPFVKLNLADALYNPKTKTLFAINTGSSTNIDDLEKGGKSIDESGNKS